ncbi:NAD-dependent succinate-semialdehyde dehydrogenase [Planctomicrobium sp. SH668]|uniref:NAD-dependent succinate-semialdehyde dehydrogenase n=1 Tax=Planctomicrobium sp. SH668 TaxID=3448126 RepID=UPI003F5BFC45
MSNHAASFRSVNPATEQVIETFKPMSGVQIEQALNVSAIAYEDWSRQPIQFRAERLHRLAAVIRDSKERLALLMSNEMGKPLAQARAEIQKCAVLCDYYSLHGEDQLATRQISDLPSIRQSVRFDPIGGVLAVMPWNYPFWQVFRFAVPTLLAGNIGFLKHASNVTGCALAIEDLMTAAGFPSGVFQTLVVGSQKLPELISRPEIRAVTLTGSEQAGRSIAEVAARNLKKSVLELGGSDPFIVFADADLPLAISKGVEARMQNCGQSCIAAKRFLVHESVYDAFIDGMESALKEMKVGDPLEEATQLGPLAREDLRNEIHEQVQKTIEQGGRLCTGGKAVDRKGWYYEPTLIADVMPGMTAFDEETFGPVASVTKFSGIEQAIQLANASEFGLGASLWSTDLDFAEKLAGRIESGMVFINDYTKSSPEIPFGGIKRSGYGRELGEFGIHEFVNIKTVSLKK